MASFEEKFNAAVNVIKGLPKNGPYQPSPTMMLKFYGLYKQATEGPCHQKKPAFWDIIGKAKWDAWNSNRHLTKLQAMEKYVVGLREIIETMSFTENVQNFVGSLNGMDINLDELEMIAPGMREMAESHPNSPFNSRTNSPQHGASANNVQTFNGLKEEEDHPAPSTNGHVILNGDDAGSDSATPPPTPVATEPEQVSTTIPPTYSIISNGTSTSAVVDQSDDEYGDPFDMQHDLTEAMLQNSELLKQIQATVLRMNADLVSVNQRMSSLEKSVQEVRTSVTQQKPKFNGSSKTVRHNPKWWPFEGISPAWFALLLLWPFIVNRMSIVLIQTRRK